MVMKFKICGMKDPDNIKEIVALKPDYMGFIFYPKSSRYVGEDLDHKMMKSIPSSITKVGVYVNPTREEVIKTSVGYNLNVIQLHGDEDPGFCRSLSFYGEIVKSFGISEDFDFRVLEDYRSCCSYFLFDTKTPGFGGSGEKFNWDILTEYRESKPFFLSGGIGFAQIEEIRRAKRNFRHLYGLDLNSKFEISPGIKDGKKIKRVMTALKS
jgi:phosphoribosylanthranilate isomerase